MPTDGNPQKGKAGVPSFEDLQTRGTGRRSAVRERRLRRALRRSWGTEQRAGPWAGASRRAVWGGARRRGRGGRAPRRLPQLRAGIVAVSWRRS
nr:uncharacterized protein LOC129479385 isoform X1 [Symphalangus syndactylus]XP_055128381.1 uncharacterized protein LOC129479385 isoform X1 [Symphalangus syndactylus]